MFVRLGITELGKGDGSSDSTIISILRRRAENNRGGVEKKRGGVKKKRGGLGEVPVREAESKA